MIRIVVVFFAILSALYPAAAQKSNSGSAGANAGSAASSHAAEVALQVRAYRKANEAAIIGEFTSLLAIPNVATDKPNIDRNATTIAAMLERRGFRMQQLPIEGRGPVIFAELPAPGAAHTVIIYAHYDGQPVDEKVWTGSGPFEPILRTDSIDAGGKIIPFPAPPAHYDDNWRIYARSTSDDKAPIVAILAALDALRSRNIPLANNLKLFWRARRKRAPPISSGWPTRTAISSLATCSSTPMARLINPGSRS